jgi:hypothetical protein
MPTYKIRAPDGNTYKIDGPAGASDDQVREQVLKQHPGAEAASSAAGDFFKSIPTGAVKGFSGLASEAGQAAQAEMGQTPDVPSAPQTENILEQQVTGPLHKPQGFTGRVGAGLGEAAITPTTYMGPGGALAKTAGAVGSTLGAEGLAEVAKDTGLERGARVLGGLAGGGLAGAVAGGAQSARLAKELPTLARHKEAADAGYKLMRNMDVQISKEGADQLAEQVRAQLADKNFLPHLAGDTFKTLEVLDGFKGPVKIGEIDKVRSALGNVSVTKPEDRTAANIAIDTIDHWLMNVPPDHVLAGDPVLAAALLKHSQGEWATYKKLQDLEKSTKTGQHRADVSGTGANTINTQRQEIRKILDSEKRSRGMSQEARDKMEEIVTGTWLGNQARKLSKFAPAGPVSLLSILGTDLAGGHGAAAGLAATGIAAKSLGEYLTARQIRELESIINRNAPISRPIAARNAAGEAEAQMLPGVSALRGAVPALVGSGTSE